MGRLLILLLWGILLYLLWNLFFPSPKTRRTGEKHENGVETMGFDPNCNTFVPKTNAIRKKIQGKTHYFCSRRCLKEYKEKLRRLI